MNGTLRVDGLEIASKVVVLTVGGACGVNARYWLGLLVARWLGVRFPWATFAINVSGSFAIGLAAMILAERWPHPLVRIFALTGFLGGYTTFSAYLFESFSLWERGDRTLAASNLVGSVAAGLLAVVLGVTLGRWLLGPSLDAEKATPGHSAQFESRLEAISDALSGQEPPDEPSV